MITENNKYSITNYSYDNGLEPKTTSVLKDNEGFVWITTSNGVQRFDGYNFSILEFKDDVDLTNEKFTSVTEAEGYLWFGTVSRGLIKYDKQTNTFTAYEKKPGAKGSLNSNNIWTVFNAGNGKLFVSTTTAFYTFDIKTGTFSIKLNKFITKFTSDSKGSILAAGKNTIYIVQEPDYKLVPLINLNTKESIISSVSITSSIDSGYIVFSKGKSIFIYNIKNKKLQEIDIQLKRSSGSFFTTIADSNIVWIGTNNGLYKASLNQANFEITPFATSEFPNSRFKGLTIKNLYIDKEKVLWVATNDAGINKITKEEPKITDVLQSLNLDEEIIYNIKAIQNELYLGTKFGFKIVNLNNKQSIKIESNLLDRKKKGESSGQSLIKLKNSNELLLSELLNGVYILNLDNKQIRSFENFKKNSVRSLIEDKNGNVWLSLVSRSILRVNPVTNMSKELTLPGTGNQRDYIPIIYEDSEGGIWIGTASTGLYKYEAAKDTIRRVYLKKSDFREKEIGIYTIKEDKIGNIWLGSNIGIVKINKTTFETKVYQPRWKEIINTNSPVDILALEFDRYQNLWFTTQFYVGRLNTTTGDYYIFRTESNKTRFFSGNSSTLLSDGSILFGGDNTLCLISPQYINQIIPNISINRIELAKDSIVTYYNPALHGDISLPYHKNYFAAEFSALSYIAPENNIYKYKLEGYDHEWIEAGSERIARYSNLEPGDYKFRVIGTNNDGVWNSEGASVNITILPPFYRTTYAYVIYFILLLLSVYGIVKFFLYRAYLQNEAIIKKREAEQLHKLDELKSRFFANVSHELRTPLTLIIGPLESLALKEGTESKFQLMYLQAKKLLEMINQLLDISRLESGKMVININKKDILRHSRAILLSFLPIAEKRNIKLTFHSDEDEIITHYDSDKFEKILLNLLSNALKFSPNHDEIVVELAVSGEKQFKNKLFPEGYVHIKVKDNGPGIPSAEAEKIFERFYQSERNGNKKGGTGIGLSIVHDFVELHGGIVYVNTEIQKGTEFNVVLPMGDTLLNESNQFGFDSDYSVEHSPDISLLPIPNPYTESAPKKIVLIVEDNEEVNNYIQNVLSSEYRVIQTFNGEEGVYSARKTVPDLVVCDIMMPGIDGNEVCRILKTDEITSHIPVLLLTAKAGIESKLEGLETGADDYVTKPFSEEELKLRIKNLIRGREIMREKFAGQLSLNPAEITVNSTDKLFFEKLKGIVDDNMSNASFSVEEMADKIGMTRMTLNRKIKALTGLTPRELIQEMRLIRAASLLEQKAGNVSEVAFMVGFKEASYFTKCFQKKFNLLPSEYSTQSAEKI